MLSGGNRRKRAADARTDALRSVRMLFRCELCGNHVEATRLRAHVAYACPVLILRRSVVLTGVADV